MMSATSAGCAGKVFSKRPVSKAPRGVRRGRSLASFIDHGFFQNIKVVTHCHGLKGPPSD